MRIRRTLGDPVEDMQWQWFGKHKQVALAPTVCFQVSSFLDVLIYVFQAGEAAVTATISIGLAGTVGDGRGFQATTCNTGNHSPYEETPGMAEDGRG